MWYRSYRDHVIMAFPSFDTATHSWAPQANISWVIGPLRESAFVRFPMRAASESEAVDCALKAARTWIDKHKRENRELWGAALEPETSPAGKLVMRNTRQVPRIHTALSRNSGRTLSFDDFKANVASLGANVTERSLLKSYGALIQLRKSSHCSWALIKSKLKRSQENIAARQPTNRRAQPAGLPLTPRDWRRII